MTDDDKTKRWLAEELSDAERTEFERTEEFAKLDKLMKALSHFKAPDYNVDQEYSRLSNNISHKSKTISLYEKISPVCRIAAVLTIILAAGYLIYTQSRRVADSKEWITEQHSVYLPDSSYVRLNADSKIKFSDQTWEKERNVELVGEAFFKVKKGAMFQVKTNQGTVTVLGTEFGVKDWEGYYEVTCYSGSVQVMAAQHAEVLKPGAAFRIIDNKEENYTIHDQTEPDWLKGESNFKSVPLKHVIQELERQYNVTINADKADLNQLFSGGFTHNNLEIALQSITIPVNLNYEINGNKIVITVEGQ